MDGSGIRPGRGSDVVDGPRRGPGRRGPRSGHGLQPGPQGAVDPCGYAGSVPSTEATSTSGKAFNS
jgi:hypothetical protein